MTWPHRLVRLWPRASRPPADTGRELDEELRFHLEEQIQTNLATGMPLADARHAASVRLGNTTLIKEDTAAIWRWAWWDATGQDLRLAARLLLKQRGFSALAVVVLALGTGANTAVFSAANSVLFKPLPARDSDRLVWVSRSRSPSAPLQEYRDFREAATTVIGLAAFQSRPMSVRLEAGPELAQVGLVSGNYFTVLGVDATRGRVILPADVGTDRSVPVAVISDEFWRGRLDGDPDVVGRSITVNGDSFTVTGVAPPGFRGVGLPIRDDLWIPVLTAGIDQHRMQMVGRLGDGVTIARAEAEFRTLGDRLTAAAPGPRRRGAVTVVEANGPHPLIRDVAAPFALLLVAFVALVLLVASFNLASLLLARSSTRAHEIGVRLALGAGRGRVVRQLLTEGVLLTAVGATLGLMMAFGASRWLSSLTLDVNLSGPFPSVVSLDAGFDWRVLAFTGIAAIACVLTFALVPALQATRTDVLPALRGESLLAGSRRRSRTRSVLITSQLAVSALLLTATGLLLQSWWNGATTDIGFEPAQVLAVRVDPQLRGYSREEGFQFYTALAARLETLPGVDASSIVQTIPLNLTGFFAVLLRPDQPDPPPEELRPGSPYTVGANSVAPGYFRTIGIPLLAGRDFTRSDGPDTRLVVIINESMANQYWPGETAVGQRLRQPAGPTSPESYVEVVGVVADAQYVSIGEPQSRFVYYPLLQSYSGFGSVLVKSAGDPMAMLTPVRDLVAELDPDMSATRASRMDSLTGVSLLPVSIAALVAGTVGALALLLAAIGVAGVLSFLVRQRTREIGVRMALGASAGSVARLVVTQSLRWVVIGLSLGLAASFLLSRFVSGLLRDVSPNDPLTLLAAATALLSVGVLASLIPARHAARTDPMTALRAE